MTFLLLIDKKLYSLLESDILVFNDGRRVGAGQASTHTLCKLQEGLSTQPSNDNQRQGRRLVLLPSWIPRRGQRICIVLIIPMAASFVKCTDSYLSQGGFARVYEVQDQKRGRRAVKVVQKAGIRTKKNKTKVGEDCMNGSFLVKKRC